MSKKVWLLIFCLLTTGCSSILGIKDRDINSIHSSSASTEYIEESTTVSSNEYLIEPETRKSLGDISIDAGNDDYSSNSQLVAPTKPTEPTEPSTEETIQETVWVTDSTQIDFREETTVIQQTTEYRDWGETPTMYSSQLGNPKYRTNISIPDVSGVSKDAYGNYIIPYEMFGYSSKLPTNERGKIPYIFWYDEFGNILNPFPDNLDKYKDKFELGTYLDENKLSHLLPTVAVN